MMVLTRCLTMEETVPINAQSQYSIMFEPRREYGPQHRQAPHRSRIANIKNTCVLLFINQRDVLVNSSGILGTCKLTFIQLHLHSHRHSDSQWMIFF